MAETSKGKKIVRVHGYTNRDGTKVPMHDRSTPHTSRGSKPRQIRRGGRSTSR